MGHVAYNTICGVRILQQELDVKQFDYMTVLGTPFLMVRRSHVVCQCRCGKVSVVKVKHLRNLHARSCGCLKIELTKKRFTTHGRSNTTTYRIWAGIVSRCTNENRPQSSDYVGRGIVVCDRWRNSFDAFLEDMGERPTRSHSIERIDNNLGYDPTNCKWATAVEQANNKRSSLIVELYGKRKTVAEWSRVSLVPADSIYHRLARGWSPQKAVFFMGDMMTRSVNKRLCLNG